MGSGNDQSARPGTVLSQPLDVKVVNAGGSGVSGVTVQFDVATGGGTVNPSSTVTHGDGTAQTIWTIGPADSVQTVKATSTGLTGSPVTFTARILPDTANVASVQINYAQPSLALGAPITLTASAFDARGNTLKNRVTTWSSSNPSVVTVKAEGVTTGLATGSATITATVEGKSVVSEVTVTAFQMIAPGSDNTCAITTAGRLYCAGAAYGARAKPVGGALRFTTVDLGGDATPTTHSFACAVAVDGRGYCWGNNTSGELGVGDNPGTVVPPTLISGSLTFQTISVGIDFACGIVVGGDAYCWGNGTDGHLGRGDQQSSNVPVAVTGGLKFVQLEAGSFDACGLTAPGDIYCWGRNVLGEVGSGVTNPYQATPSLVVGGHKFKTLATHDPSVCALTLEGQAYCWGNNTIKQLGASTNETCYGEKPCSSTPLPVNGGPFSSISASLSAMCAITNDLQTYCWGYNQQGKFGVDPAAFGCTTFGALAGCTASPYPTVKGFRTLWGGARDYCGIATSGVGYCWGANDTNQLGNLSAADLSFSPVPFTIDPGGG